jgi:mitogen-activated protein kinase 15
LVNVLRAENKVDLYMAFELMETDLHATIRSKVLQEVHKKFVTYQLLRCMRFLHSRQIIHRDLKPANVLLNSDCRVKLADFGLARSLVTLQGEQQRRPILTDYIATRWYRPPEIVFGTTHYTKAVDMWALGCLVGELLTGKPLFPGSSTVNQMERIIAAVGYPTPQDLEVMRSNHTESIMNSLSAITPKPIRAWLAPYNNPEATDLIVKLLAFNPERRLTAAQAMTHPYVAEFCSPDELLPDPPDIAPITVPLPDFERFTVDEYRDALHRDILKRKKEIKKRKKDKKAAKEARKAARSAETNVDAGDDEYYEDDYVPE